jgi:hypothetical protein
VTEHIDVIDLLRTNGEDCKCHAIGAQGCGCGADWGEKHIGTAIDAIVSLREQLVRSRLDRDAWISEYQKERELSDFLHDAITFPGATDSDMIKRRIEAVGKYKKVRNGGSL